MSHVLNNILSSGYLREYEHHNNIHIPDDVQQIIIKYSKQYAIYTIGTDHPLEAMHKLIGDPSDIYTNQYGINIKSRSNELYIMNDNNKTFNTNAVAPITSSLSIKTTSHGISNDRNLFVYTSNDLLFQTQICSEFLSHPINYIFNQINTQSMDSITDIQCGISHTLMLTKSGRVYSMGANDVGQCGLNMKKYTNISQPTLIMENVESIAVGAYHNLLLNKNYKLYVCGYNYVGQIGITQNDINDRYWQSIDNDAYISDTPDTLETIEISDYEEEEEESNDGWNGNEFEMIDTSDSDSDDNNDCYFNKHDQYGNETLLFIDIPIINKYFDDLNIKIVKIYAGKFHSLCIDNNGIVYTFGGNVFGNLGNGQITEFNHTNAIPQMPILNKNIEVIDGSCGENHNILLTNKNNIICFGDNSQNQCSIINKNKIINKPFMIEKNKEFGIDNNTVIEKVICLKNKSLIFVDPYAK